jgi:actin-related protein
MFGGDQITALVFDIGRCKTRIGWAGEDAPSHVYDTTEMDHAFELLNVESSEHPLMLAEPSWNPKEEREKMVQLCFERFNTPGLYLGRSAVLSAFAAGKSTALVLDSGYSSSVVPVFEGYIVKKAIEQSALGGNFISEQVLAFLSKQNIDLTPSHLIKEKRAVETNAPPKFVKKDLPLKNQHLLIHDFKETVLNVSETTFDGASLAKRPLKKYEFPTGYNTVFGVDRFSLVECLFNSDYITKVLYSNIAVRSTPHDYSPNAKV